MSSAGAEEENKEDVQEDVEEQAEEGESSSDTSSENEELANQDEIKPEQAPWRQARLGSSQYTLKKLDKLYPKGLRETINKTEGKLFNTLNILVKEAMEAKFEEAGPSTDLGEKILKVLFVIKRLTDSFVVSVKNENVAVFLARVFEYLLKIERNWYLGRRVLRSLVQLRFDALDLTQAHKVLNTPTTIRWLLDTLFELSLTRDTDLRVGNEPKSLAVTAFLSLIGRVNIAFKSNFSTFYEHMKRRKYDFFNADGVRYRAAFFPIRVLEKAELDVLVNEMIAMLQTDSKISSKTTVSFFFQAVKNKNFKANTLILQRLVYDIDNLPTELVRDNQGMQKKYIEQLANFMSRLIFRPSNNIDDLTIILNSVTGYIDTIVDDFHPKTQLTLRKIYYQKLVHEFLGHYIREAKKLKKKNSIDFDPIKYQLHPIIKRILNFSIFDRFNTSFELRIMGLVYLDAEYFLEYLLSKIQFAFGFQEFRKVDIIKSIESVGDVVTNNPAYTQNLTWILPKLLSELDNSSESTSVQTITSTITSYLENFVGLEENPEAIPHLKRILDDIGEVGLSLFEYYMRKSQDYDILKNTLLVLFNLTEHSRKKMKEKIFSLIASGFDKVSEGNTKELLFRVYTSYPQETETELIKWIHKKVLTKSEPNELDKFTLSGILQQFGINSVIFTVNTSNEIALNKIHSVLCSLGPVSATLSHELLSYLITVSAITFENDNESVIKSTIKTLSTLFDGLIPKTKSLASNELAKCLKKSFETQWNVPEIDQAQRATQLVQGILFEAFSAAEKTMREGLQTEVKEAKGSLLVDLFKSTLPDYVKKNTEITIQKDHGKSMISCMRLINSVLAKVWVSWVYVRSSKLQGLIRGYKLRAREFLVQSGISTNQKAREAYFNSLIVLGNLSHDLVVGDPTTRIYAGAFRPFAGFFDKIDMSSKNSFAESNLLSIFPVFSYFSGEGLLPIDSLLLPANLQNYTIQAIQPDPKWLCSHQLETLLIREPVSEILNVAVLIVSHFDKSSLNNISSLFGKTWAVMSNQDLEKYLLQPLLHSLSVEQGDSEKYSKTAASIETVISLFLKFNVIESATTVNMILHLADEMAKKGQFSKVQTGYFKLTDHLLLWGSVSGSTSSLVDLEVFSRKTDQEVTLLDLVQFTTKTLLSYERWGPDYRAAIVAWIINGLASKNINKRIVFMSVLLFINRLVKSKDFKEEKITVEQAPFLDARGFADLNTVEQAYTEIRARIGLGASKNVTFTPDQKKELDKLNLDLYPANLASQYLTLPFEVLSITKAEDTVAEFRKRTSTPTATPFSSLETAMVEYIRLVIMEYSDSIDENNLTVKYKYVELMVDTKKRNQTTFGRESLIFATLKQAAVFLGFASMKRIYQKLVEENPEQNSDFKKVILIMFCACLSASLRYTEEEFRDLLTFGMEIMKPLMNVLNSKHLQTLLVYLTVSLKSTLNFRRLNIFFSLIRDLLLAESPQNQCYFLNVMIFQVSTSQCVVPDQFYSLVEYVLPKMDLDDINTVASVSKIYLTIGFIRYLVSFNSNFAATGLHVLEESTLTRPAHAITNPQITKNFSDFIETISKKKVLTRIEVLKTLLSILYLKRVDTLNFEIMKQIVGLIFTLDPNEDHGMSAIIQGLHKMVDQLKNTVSCTYPAKEAITRFFSDQYDKVNSVECLKSLIKLSKLGLSNEITPEVDSLVLKLAKDTRIPLRDSIDSFLRHDLFSNLSNKAMYGYAQNIFKRIDDAVAAKSKIKEKTDEQFKILNRELDRYCTILIGIVASRQWQMDIQVEECLTYIVKSKRNSSEALKRFSNFIANFWSKKAVHQDFNDHELPEELRDELNDFNNPYSYHA